MIAHLAASSRVARFAASLASRPTPPHLRPCRLCGVPLDRHRRCATADCPILLGDGHGPADDEGRCYICNRLARSRPTRNQRGI